MDEINTPVSKKVGEGFRALTESYDVELELHNQTFHFHIDRGFIWKPSVSAVAWGLVPPHMIFIAALVHDWLYRWQGNTRKHGFVEVQDAVLEGRVSLKTVDRHFADEVFRALMKQTGVPWWRRKLAYYAVSWFGWKAWNDPPKYKTLEAKRKNLEGFDLED